LRGESGGLWCHYWVISGLNTPLQLPRMASSSRGTRGSDSSSTSIHGTRGSNRDWKPSTSFVNAPRPHRVHEHDPGLLPSD